MEISWNNLPSVVLLEVFSYLSHTEKIRASSTCKYWRCTLYHPSYWKTINFVIKANDQESISRTRYLTSCFAKKLRNARITFDSMEPFVMYEVASVLQQLSKNMNLRRLILEPSHCRYEFFERNSERKDYFERYLLNPLQILVQQSRNLQALSFGCSEELTTQAKPILDIMHKYQSCSLDHLGIASVKEDPDHYQLLDLDSAYFCSFQQLQVLSLDYDHVSDSLLATLRNTKLIRLIIHVHGIEESHPGTSNVAWSNFTHHNPSCELRLNFIHSYDSVEILQSDILKPAMPLSHFKAFFCHGINIAALHLLSSWYSDHLRSLWLVDSLQTSESPYLILDSQEEPTDPLVMASWICTKLEEIILLGYKYFADDLIAIARLRGSALKRLDLFTEDIAEAEEYSLEDLELEVSQALGRPWTALTNSQLHPAITNPLRHNTDEFILPITLLDHDV